jgi:hypothetical protein
MRKKLFYMVAHNLAIESEQTTAACDFGVYK